MAKQTAVQWLVMTYNQRQGYIRFEDIDKANAMDKEQIENAFDMGRDETTRSFIEDGEQYYRENYGKSN